MRVSRTEGRVVVNPAARRMWRMGVRRREGWSWFGDTIVLKVLYVTDDKVV